MPPLSCSERGGISVHWKDLPKVPIKELLGHPAGCLMSLLFKSQRLEFGAEAATQRLWPISLRREAAADIGAVETERSDDGVAANGQRLGHLLNVLLLVVRIDQKVERSSIVPDGINPIKVVLDDISFNPMHCVRAPTEAFLCECQRRSRQIEHCHVCVVRIQKAVDEN